MIAISRDGGNKLSSPLSWRRALQRLVARCRRFQSCSRFRFRPSSMTLILLLFVFRFFRFSVFRAWSIVLDAGSIGPCFWVDGWMMGEWLDVSVGESVCSFVHELLPRQGLGSVPVHQEHHPQGKNNTCFTYVCALVCASQHTERRLCMYAALRAARDASILVL